MLHRRITYCVLIAQCLQVQAEVNDLHVSTTIFASFCLSGLKSQDVRHYCCTDMLFLVVRNNKFGFAVCTSHTRDATPEC